MLISNVFFRIFVVTLFCMTHFAYAQNSDHTLSAFIMETQDKLSRYLQKQQWAKSISHALLNKTQNPDQTDTDIMSIISYVATSISAQGKFIVLSPKHFQIFIEAIEELSSDELKFQAKMLLVNSLIRNNQVKLAMEMAKTSHRQELLDKVYETYILALASRGYSDKVLQLLKKDTFKKYTDQAFFKISQFHSHRKEAQKALAWAKQIKSPTIADDARLVIGQLYLEQNLSQKQILAFASLFHSNFHRSAFMANYINLFIEEGALDKARKMLKDENIKIEKSVHMQLSANILLKLIQSGQAMEAKIGLRELERQYKQESSDLRDSLWMDLFYYYLYTAHDTYEAKKIIKKIQNSAIRSQLIEAYQIHLQNSKLI